MVKQLRKLRELESDLRAPRALPAEAPPNTLIALLIQSASSATGGAVAGCISANYRTARSIVVAVPAVALLVRARKFRLAMAVTRRREAHPLGGSAKSTHSADQNYADCDPNHPYAPHHLDSFLSCRRPFLLVSV